jgi:hypothetical protein
MCMAKCEYVCHATCILQLSDSVAEDQSTQLCNGCAAQWLPAMAQFLEPMAESEKEKGLELDSDGVPQQGGKVKRALKPDWLPKVVQKRPKGPAKPGVTLKKAHKNAKGKPNEEEKEGQASVKLEEVPCPNCKTWKGIPSSGNALQQARAKVHRHKAKEDQRPATRGQRLRGGLRTMCVGLL